MTTSTEIYGLTLEQVDYLVRTSRLEQGLGETLSIDQLERIAIVTRSPDRAAS